ncbi:MAG: methylenetetrahydrofolate--tRNA-(uracil(54)-C(5))-methyltransferase (FADH(2)-oxidizing) TrmFO [Clostridia bacterium]|nr:methylenetetrahydrofolate--tRNA-(uracil(54)-C(5))-methyltransferase (FADH(2)-oxidizing) TrmFO [Clostridia bacterium]
MTKRPVRIIGAGLAGCEAAYQLAKRGVEVELYEMKPKKYSPAHHSEGFAELVCSNSFRSNNIENAVGLLKEEMRRLDSIVIDTAYKTSVPAGTALAVNRYDFSDIITNKIRSFDNIRIINEEYTDLHYDGITIIATGPLTSEDLTKAIASYIDSDEYLHFFDAAAPIVDASSIDMSKVSHGSRYEKGSDYLNCYMNREQYDRFYRELINAECAELKDFEDDNVFEGCMPVEVMAKRGYRTLLFGPLKPVGFKDENGDTPYAVVQLRKEDVDARSYNIVGFQTHLKFPEQKRVFSLIPGLENASYLRYGVMHMNTFLNSPKLLDRFYRLRKDPDIYFAGQITGVEGYIESASSGLYAALCAYQQYLGKEIIELSSATCLGALPRYVSSSFSSNFQPMNINFSIVDEPYPAIRNKREKRQKIVENSLENIQSYKDRIDLLN